MAGPSFEKRDHLASLQTGSRATEASISFRARSNGRKAFRSAGKWLLCFAGAIDPDDLRIMERAIAEGSNG
jgi:hypothetical protein